MWDLDWLSVWAGAATGGWVVSFVLFVRTLASRERLASALADEKDRSEAWRILSLDAEARARGVGGHAGVRPTIERVQA